jgi:hypothetical protein
LGYPGGQKLALGAGTELGMPAAALVVLWLKSERLEPDQVGGPEAGEGVQ